ncbi:MAG: hypothetical protein EU518_01435 [Promethearchaeota archaeon]|nr:MAG: hypothetical protein EU518_01435 [Candidatus Lokiarchaeota archaeon]
MFKLSYGIDNKEINKASFLIFVLTLLLMISSAILINLNFYLLLFFSLILSLIISYKFNFYLYNKLLKRGKELTSSLYIIKIDYSLIQITKNKNEDTILEFITLIISYNLPISKKFEEILSNIHSGSLPDMELKEFLSPSIDFNNFKNNIIIQKDHPILEKNEFKNSKLEDDFKVYLRELNTKISIIFFIGIFYPIGLCFLVTFISFNQIILIVSVPIFFLLLNYLFRKFVAIDHYLMGLIRNNKKSEKREFNEILNLIKSFSYYLENNLSPERAFLKAYLDKNEHSLILERRVPEIQLFLNGSLQFIELMNIFSRKMSSYRFKIIFNSISKMVKENSKMSSKKIRDILKVLNKHLKLERKITMIIKAESIKVYIFIFILPIILGTLGALMSFLPYIMIDLLEINEINEILYLNLNLRFYDLLIFLLILLSSNFISTYYFLATISLKNKNLLLIIGEILLIICFLISINNILPLIG